MCYCPEGEGFVAQFLDEICENARKSVDEVIEMAGTTGFDLGDRTGGYLCCLKSPFKVLAIYPKLIGIVTNGRDEKYRTFSRKKGEDLVEHLSEGHELSSQSRDLDEERYGGAVKGIKSSHNNAEFIFAFSGLPEMLDEAVMLLTAVRSGCMTMEYAKELATTKSLVTENGNTFFLKNQWGVADEEVEAQ